MGEFISIDIDMEKCTGITGCGSCVSVCPVNIFRAEGQEPAVIRENEDECILCSQCLDDCSPDAIRVRKLYETE